MSIYEEGKKEIDLLVKKYGSAHELSDPYWREDKGDMDRYTIYIDTPEDDEVILGGLEYDEIDHYYAQMVEYYEELIKRETED